MGHQKDAEVLQELMKESAKIQQSFFRHILLLSSTLFGILISLHSSTLESLFARWSFALAVVLLGLGILSIAIALYGHVDTLKRARVRYSEEARNALRERRDTGYVSVRERKIFALCETTGYIALLLSVLSLSFYAVVVNLF